MPSLKDKISGRIKALTSKQKTPQESWDHRWSTRTAPMRWETEKIPTVLISALDDGFFPTGGSILDIGCGAGDVTAWLAERGHRAVGSDFSKEAVARASANHQHELLSYRVGDMSTPWQSPEQFDGLFDRGCLHCLPESDIETYVANAAASLAAHGPFLLLHKLGQLRYGTFPPEEVERRLRDAFSPFFVVDRVERIDIMDGEIDKADNEIAALAIWMTRRP